MAFNKGWFQENRSSIIADVAQEQIKDKSAWPIFVYDWINKTPNTEAGLKAANEPRNRHYQWTEIIKGNESVYLSPMGATTLEKHQGTGQKLPNGKIDGSYYDVKYSKEDSVVFYGMKTSNNGGNTFSTTSFGGFGDFTTIGDEATIEMKTNQKVSKDLLTKFFFIPDVAQITENYNAGQYDQDFNDNDIYYIQSYTNYYNENTGEFIYSEITFSNIQQNMSQSGQIIEQHIYLSSPGAGYLVPKILFDENGVPLPREKGWEWNTNYTQDKGVKTIQIEVSGNYAICALEVWGYPVDPNHNDINDKRWYAPRKLLVEHFRLPLNENFYKISPNNNEFVIVDGKLTASADLKSYKLMVKDFAGDDPMDYQGIINTTKETSIGTNITGYTINDQQFGYSDKFVDNSLQVDGTTHNTDLDNIYTTDDQWFYDGQKDDGTDGIGIKKFSLKDVHKVPNGDHSAVQMMNMMSFALSPINRLPYEVNSKLTWSLEDMSGFGSYINRPLKGMSPTWRTITSSTNVLMPKLQTIPMLVNKSLYDVAVNTIYESNFLNPKNAYFAWDLSQINVSNQDGLGKIPLDFFQKAESTRIGAVLSNKSNSTSITFTLTDKITAEAYDKDKQNDLGQENISTVMLNQDVDNKRYKVKGDSFSTPAIQNDENVLTDVNGDRYIITNIGIKGIGDGDVRITTFNDDVDNIPANVDYHEYINFQTYMQSTAAFKNNQIREWDSNLNTSYLDFLDKYLNEVFNWPKALPQPQPEYYLPDIVNSRTNLSDYANWFIPGQSGFNSWEPDVQEKNNFYKYVSHLDYLERNDPRAPYGHGHVKQSYNILINDFADNGYTTVDSLEKDYEKIQINTDNLIFKLQRLIGRGNGNVGDETREIRELSKDVYDKSFSTKISTTLKIRDIITWNETDAIDDYAYKNNLNSQSFNGDYSIYRPGWGDNEDLKSELWVVMGSISDSSTQRSGWYYFLYFKQYQDENKVNHLELKMNLFFHGNINFGNVLGTGGDNGHWSLASTSLMLWVGLNNSENIQLPSIYGKNVGWPSANQRLLGNSNAYWKINNTAVSYKLKK